MTEEQQKTVMHTRKKKKKKGLKVGTLVIHQLDEENEIDEDIKFEFKGKKGVAPWPICGEDISDKQDNDCLEVEIEDDENESGIWGHIHYDKKAGFYILATEEGAKSENGLKILMKSR